MCRSLQLCLVCLPLVCAAAQEGGAREWLPATPDRLPRWRGFNLLEKFQVASNKPFVEDDFRQIAALGFNFVRLPMDYRCWIVDGDWTRFNEATLKEIDQAVAWGEQYGIHVMLNFHRAPGYTVARPAEARSLWTDPEAQRVCALHWATFARRYRGIPPERLSFNLFNEPANIEGTAYAAVVEPIVAAIRAEDPARLIVSDGLQWGGRPCLELLPLRLAQATRGYAPMEVTHYQASWVGGADKMPVPTWPVAVANGTLAAPTKSDLSEAARGPLVLEGEFPAGLLRLRVGIVSHRAELEVRADGKPVWQRAFVNGPGEGEWKEARYLEQYKLYQNLYDKDYDAPIPAGAKQLEVAVKSGDWLQITALSVCPAEGAPSELRLTNAWNRQPARLRYQPGQPLQSDEALDRAWLQATMIKPWQEAQARGIGVMVGEFGAFNRTPHEVTLRWMEDCLKNWHEAGWGWALWNFRGSFGILDSGRKDVTYESYEGHQLDRPMLDLLLKY